MNAELITAVAFAIYAEFVRDLDPARARHRFERLKPAIRRRYENEARAAVQAVEAYRMGDLFA